MKTMRKPRSFNSEAQLVNKLTNKLREEGFVVRTEVSNMGQSADVVARRGKWVTIIEVKWRDWQRALIQCKAHELVADFICIAIASVSVPELFTEQAKLLGYGILHYSESTKQFEWVLKPRMNKGVWPPQRKYWSHSARRIAQHAD
jgi:Holliday junction resolvase